MKNSEHIKSIMKIVTSYNGNLPRWVFTVCTTQLMNAWISSYCNSFLHQISLQPIRKLLRHLSLDETNGLTDQLTSLQLSYEAMYNTEIKRGDMSGYVRPEASLRYHKLKLFHVNDDQSAGIIMKEWSWLVSQVSRQPSPDKRSEGSAVFPQEFPALPFPPFCRDKPPTGAIPLGSALAARRSREGGLAYTMLFVWED